MLAGHWPALAWHWPALAWHWPALSWHWPGSDPPCHESRLRVCVRAECNGQPCTRDAARAATPLCATHAPIGSRRLAQAPGRGGYVRNFSFTDSVLTGVGTSRALPRRDAMRCCRRVAFERTFPTGTFPIRKSLPRSSPRSSVRTAGLTLHPSSRCPFHETWGTSYRKTGTDNRSNTSANRQRKNAGDRNAARRGRSAVAGTAFGIMLTYADHPQPPLTWNASALPTLDGFVFARIRGSGVQASWMACADGRHTPETLTHTSMPTHTHTQLHAHTDARSHTHTCARAHSHTHRHTHTHTLTHTHAHAHTHTCTCICTRTHTLTITRRWLIAAVWLQLAGSLNGTAPGGATGVKITGVRIEDVDLGVRARGWVCSNVSGAARDVHPPIGCL